MAFENEYVKIYRKLVNWEWYTDVNTKVLFLHCLLKANWKPGDWKGIHYERGQFITSLSTLAEETGLSMKMVRTAMEHLMMTGEIDSMRQDKGTTKCRIITVLHYDDYQQSGKTGASEGQDEGKTRASEGQQYKNIKNNKNSIEVKKDILYSDSISQIFDYLNFKTGKNYTGRSDAQRKHIIARLKEGYTVEEFKKVIDNKCLAWKNDEKMQQYLRPETLFSTKFESYLNDVETERQRERREAAEYHERQIEAIKQTERFESSIFN